MSKKPNARWQKIRAKGRRSYILKLALVLASLNFVGTLIFRSLWPSDSAPHVPLEALYFAGFHSLGGLITGLLVGAWTWRANEKEYASALEEEEGGDGAESHP